MPIDLKRAKDIFLKATELSTDADRVAYLDHVCANDSELRNRVEALLRAHDPSSSFLDRPAVATPDPDHVGTVVLDFSSSGTAESDSDDNQESNWLRFLSPSSRPDSLGRIGCYEVLEVLGQGGFGIVFRAFDEKLQRVVAVKILSPQLAVTSPARKRFLREARSSAKVRHQHIVQVYTVEEQPLPYLVMEYIPSETLQQRIDRLGPFDFEEVVQIGRQIAEGLAAAHTQGLIHRDIKPANILIESGVLPCVKITDFGLARAADDASLTQSGTIAGTPMFMAPEQARGDALDHRADLFSLGSVLYTMCSGRPPFRAQNTVAVLRRVAEDTPRPIQEIIPETPQWLCDVITRLHAKKPEDRFATAQEVAELLLCGSKETQPPARLPPFSEAAPVTVVKVPRENVTPPEIAKISSPALAFRSWSHHRRRAFIAAVFLMCITAIGIAEGTGVTDFHGTVIRLFLPEGTLVVEVDDPKISVQVDGSDIIITEAGVREIRVTPGRHTVEARDKHGFLLKRDLVSVTKNGRQIVRISQEEPPTGTPVANAVGKGTDLKTLPRQNPKSLRTQDPDHRAAEYVLSINGMVQVNDKAVNLKAASELPPDAFRLTQVYLGDNQQVSDAGLVAFKGCRNVKLLYLYGTQVSDAGLAHFKDCKNLRDLSLTGPVVTDAGLVHFKDCVDLTELHLQRMRVTDAGLVNFKNCKNLTTLVLSSLPMSDAGLAYFQDSRNLQRLILQGSPVGDAGLANFKDCGNLELLNLQGTQVSDAGLVHIQDCRNLTELNLYGTPVRDAGLAHLKNCKKLTKLQLEQTKVTASKVEELMKALPGCKIEWNGESMESDRDAAEYVLSIRGVVHVNHKADDIRTISELPPGALRLTGVFLGVNRQVTDADLAHFQDCQHLTHLDLNGTQVTDAGLVHFAGCKNLDALELPSTQVTAAGLAHFKNCKNLKKLNLCFTQVGEAGLAHFKDCKDLIVLDLNRTQANDAALAHFKDLTNLEILHLHATQVGDACLENFKNCSRLWSLDLGGTKVSDAGLAHFKDCKKLRFIYFQNTAVTDAGMVSFAGFQELLGIELQQTKVGDEGLGHLKDSHNLTWLHLSGTSVTDVGLAHIKDHKNLTTLNLPNTKVSDTGLVHLKDLKKLTTLDLRQTQVTARGIADLKGELPGCKIEWESHVTRRAVEQTIEFRVSQIDQRSRQASQPR